MNAPDPEGVQGAWCARVHRLAHKHLDKLACDIRAHLQCGREDDALGALLVGASDLIGTRALSGYALDRLGVHAILARPQCVAHLAAAGWSVRGYEHPGSGEPILRHVVACATESLGQALAPSLSASLRAALAAGACVDEASRAGPARCSAAEELALRLAKSARTLASARLDDWIESLDVLLQAGMRRVDDKGWFAPAAVVLFEGHHHVGSDNDRASQALLRAANVVLARHDAADQARLSAWVFGRLRAYEPGLMRAQRHGFESLVRWQLAHDMPQYAQAALQAARGPGDSGRQGALELAAWLQGALAAYHLRQSACGKRQAAPDAASAVCGPPGAAARAPVVGVV